MSAPGHLYWKDMPRPTGCNGDMVKQRSTWEGASLAREGRAARSRAARRGASIRAPASRRAPRRPRARAAREAAAAPAAAPLPPPRRHWRSAVSWASSPPLRRPAQRPFAAPRPVLKTNRCVVIVRSQFFRGRVRVYPDFSGSGLLYFSHYIFKHIFS